LTFLTQSVFFSINKRRFYDSVKYIVSSIVFEGESRGEIEDITPFLGKWSGVFWDW
jgi:hypothetical protein